MSNPTVLLTTSMGDILLEVDEQNAPKTAANFLQYVDDKFYDGTIFHRVIGHFMVQGGGMSMQMKEKETREPVENEADNGLHNGPGTVAMARTQDPHSATAQFFINVAENAFLDHTAKNVQGWGYCVFAKVVDGMDVVEKIKKVRTKRMGFHDDVPVEPVSIISAERIEL